MVRFLAILRKKANLSQEELGKLIGVEKNTIWRWENEKSSPRASDIKKLAEALGVTDAELMNGPQKTEIEIRLVMNFDPMKGGITALDMNVGHSFTLCVENGRLGIIGVAPLETESDIDNFLARAKNELLIGLEAQKKKREVN